MAGLKSTALRFKGRIRRSLRRFRRQGFWATLGYVLFTALLEKCGVQVSCVFEHLRCNHVGFRNTRFGASVAGSTVAFTSADLESLEAYAGEKILQDFERAFEGGESCVVCRSESGDLAGACWLTTAARYGPAGGEDCALIQRCFTLPEHRGQGAFPLALSYAVNWLRVDRDHTARIFVECSVFNRSSQRGIVKAGFSKTGIVVQAWHWQRFVRR